MRTTIDELSELDVDLSFLVRLSVSTASPLVIRFVISSRYICSIAVVDLVYTTIIQSNTVFRSHVFQESKFSMQK